MAGVHRIIMIGFVVGIGFVLAVESCETKYTPWNNAGKGDAVYLDRHNVNCLDAGKGLNMFELKRSGENIRYRYKCCPVAKGCKLRKVTNSFTVDGDGNTLYLDRQTVDCRWNGVINEFKLHRNTQHTHWRYEYFCCDKPTALVCYDESTCFTNDGKGKNFYLDRQTIACSTGFFLQSFKLNRNSGLDKLRYVIRCCK